MSFIKVNYIITGNEYQFLSKFKLTREQQQLLVHCIKSSIRSLKETPLAKGYFPLPATTLLTTYGKYYLKNVVTPLLNLKLIERDNHYNVEQGKCIHYKATDNILLEFSNANRDYLKNINKLKWVSCNTGRKVSKIITQTYSDFNGNKYSPLITSALKNISRGSFNIRNIMDYLREQPQENPRTINDINCLLSLFNKDATFEDDFNLEYRAVYTPKFGGRIYELDGGTQSMSRQARFNLMNDTPNFYNYDLKSSQVYSLMDLFEEANVSISWLENYLDQPKQVFADRCNLSVDAWKACLMSLIMGAKVPSNKQLEYSSLCSRKAIYNTIREESESDAEAVRKLIAFSHEVKDLDKQIKQLQDYLLNDKVAKNKYFANGKIYITNSVGSTFCISDYWSLKDKKYKDLEELKRKLTAFYLQGYEACFIFYIHQLAEIYDYKVVGNYHDGVTTIGEIPQEAIEDARLASGNKYAHLEIKPIA
jgi:hypothetical protein